MLRFQDFAPHRESGLLSSKTEKLTSVLERVNRWIEEEGVDVINVETVALLPSPTPERQRELGPHHPRVVPGEEAVVKR